MAKYSIILPVRNGGYYVKECVGSVLSQTYTDFNFIVLDNCSTDGTLEWLQTLNDNRVVLIPSAKPLTIEENWGRIKDVKKNEFITLIGHDDLLYPKFLSTVDLLIIKNPTTSLFHTHFDFIDGHGKKIRSAKPMKDIYRGHEFLSAFLMSSIDSMGTGYVMRSADYDNLGGIQKKYPNLLFADFELWMSLAAIGSVVIARENCFAFRLHQSTTSTSQDFKMQKALGIFIDFLVGLQNNDERYATVIHQYGSQFLLHYCTSYAHRLLRTPLQNRNGLTVASFVEQTKLMADKLGISDSFQAQKKSSLQLAKRIDNNNILRSLFLLFKKIYPKPLL